MKTAGRLADLPRGTEIIQAHRAAQAAAEKNALTASEREELQRLRRENRQLKLERDILSNGFGNRAAWFAHKSEKTSLGSIG